MARPIALALWTLLFLGAAWAGRAQAAVIFFAEDPAEVAPIAVSTDLAGANLASVGLTGARR